MNEFEPHDYFKADDQGYISRKVFIEHVRNSYDHMRELSALIKGYDQTIDSYLDRWDQNLESLDDSIIGLLHEWIDDSTFAKIINEEIFKTKADQVDLEKVTAQLAQKATKGEIGLNDLNKNVTQFDETWFTDSVKQQWAGNTPVNATPPDKGVTSKKLADKAIYDRHLSSNVAYSNSINLFSEDDALDGFRLGTSGQQIVDSGYMLSEFIPVSAGDTLYLLTSDQTATASQCNRVALYNNDYTFNQLLTGLISPSSDKMSTTIDVGGWVRIPSRKNGTKIAFSRNIDINSVIPYQRNFRDKFAFTPKTGDVKSEHIGYGEVSDLNTNFIVPVKNLYNESDPNVESGKILTIGGLETSNFYNVSGYIPVKKGFKYTFNTIRNYKFFNYLKNYINGSWHQFPSNGQQTITAPEDGYIRFSHLNEEPVQMEEGEQSTFYVPYSFKLRDDIRTDSIPNGMMMNPLYGKRILFNGDSITASSVYPTSGWPRLIGEQNNMDWINYGTDGKTIAQIGSRNTSIVEEIDTMSAEADYIVLHGGVNDFGNSIPLGSVTSGYNDTYDEFTFAGAFESMLRKAILKWKGKKIGFILTYKSSTNPTQYQPYYNLAREICEKWSVPYIDLYKASGLTLQLDEIANEYTTNGDRKHPNEKGYEVITPKIEAWLRTL